MNIIVDIFCPYVVGNKVSHRQWQKTRTVDIYDNDVDLLLRARGTGL
jgi:hypothetical protein